jgi:poly-gamma-glutamate synthesis protein (capsule biosynthesis protein)
MTCSRNVHRPDELVVAAGGPVRRTYHRQVIWRPLVLALALLSACSTTTGEPAPTSPADASESAVAAPTLAVSDVLVTGDVSWARFMEEWAHERPRWPFQGLGQFGDYDAMVGNLECPVLHSDANPAEQEARLAFHCEPMFLGPFARYFTAVSLANNHTDNHSAAGLATTRRHLAEHGIAFFGDPDPERLDRVCGPWLVPVNTDSDATGVLPIAMCGWNGVFRIPSQSSVDVVARWADHVPVLAFPHSGLEYVAEPDSIKVDLYRRLIEAGADAVFGSHPHWVQRAEVWDGRLIVYSLGNFLFDQQSDLERTRSAAIHLRLTVTRDVEEWLAVGQECAADPGGCLRIIEQSALPKMRARLEYALVGARNQARLTHPATASETAEIERRLDWSEAMARLRSPYGPLN